MSFSAIVSLLDENAQAKVESHWDHLERNCGLKGIRITPYPHISLQVAEHHALEPVKEVLKSKAEKLATLSVQIAGLGLFSGPNPVLYLVVVKSHPLLEFHKAIWEETAPFAVNLSPNYHPSAWIPHITLAYRDINRANIGCVMQEYAFQPFDQQILLDNLALVTQEGENVGVLQERFELSGKGVAI